MTHDKLFTYNSLKFESEAIYAIYMLICNISIAYNTTTELKIFMVEFEIKVKMD